jgi:hypothetical protein
MGQPGNPAGWQASRGLGARKSPKIEKYVN